MNWIYDLIKSSVSSVREPSAEVYAAREPRDNQEENSDLQKHLKKVFGYERFRPGQEAIIQSVLSGQNVLAIMPTGAGKSLCYQLPSLLTEKTTFVVSPLIALMRDQLDGLPQEAQSRATVINSSLDSDELERRLAGVRSGKYKLVYAAPERLRQLPFLHALRQAGVSLFVIDEAHCLSTWGHDFRPDYLFIGQALDFLGSPPVLAMTATATSDIQQEIASHLGRDLRTANAGTFRPNLRLESLMLPNAEEKMRCLVGLCNETGGSGIVYVSSRKDAEGLARMLRRYRVRAMHYHAGMDTEERDAAQDDFMDDRYRVMVATVAFGMGVDKPDVRFVVHYSLPHSLENYYQEAGRAGRDGKPSRCILLSTPGDKANLTRWMRGERLSIQHLRDVYRAASQYVPAGAYGPAHDDDLQRETRLDATRVRVAVSLLEKAGMLTRRLDVPTTVTLKLRGHQSGEESDFARFIEHARLRPDQSLSISAVELASRTGIPLPQIEKTLLQWEDAGLLYYKGSGRAMLIERPHATPEMRAMLDDLLARYDQAQTVRVEIMADYAHSSQCRHGQIAAHFGSAPVSSCGMCDVCAPDASGTPVAKRAARSKAEKLSKKETRMVILRAVADLPYPLGKSGLTKMLKGSIASSVRQDRCRHFGALSAETRSEVETAITELVDAGCLTRHDDDEYPVLHLTEKGKAELER